MKKLRILFTLAILAISLTACGESEPLQTHYYFKFVNESGFDIKLVTEIIGAPNSNLIPDELILLKDQTYNWDNPLIGNPVPIYLISQKGIMECYFGDEYKLVFIGKEHEYCPANIDNYIFIENRGKKGEVYSFTFTKEMAEYAKFLNEQGLEIAGSENSLIRP